MQFSKYQLRRQEVDIAAVLGKKSRAKNSLFCSVRRKKSLTIAAKYCVCVSVCDCESHAMHCHYCIVFCCICNVLWNCISQQRDICIYFFVTAYIMTMNYSEFQRKNMSNIFLTNGNTILKYILILCVVFL